MFIPMFPWPVFRSNLLHNGSITPEQLEAMKKECYTMRKEDPIGRSRSNNASGFYIVDSGGDRSAIVNGSSTTVRYVQESITYGIGDTFLQGESGDAGLLLWTHTVVEVSGSSIIAEYSPVWPDSEVERFARGSYTICP